MAEFKTNILTGINRVEFMGILLDSSEAEALGRRLMSVASLLRDANRSTAPTQEENI